MNQLSDMWFGGVSKQNGCGKKMVRSPVAFGGYGFTNLGKCKTTLGCFQVLTVEKEIQSNRCYARIEKTEA
jgi:hypothetical protein